MTAPRVRSVCVSTIKGTPKREVERAIAVAGHGIEGDAHAGGWHRQVSLLAEDDIAGMRARGLELAPGAFGENLVIEGLDLSGLDIGTRLRAGDVELEVTQIGKACHTRCAIYAAVGDCIMPRVGLFTRVLRGGELLPGSTLEVVRLTPRVTPRPASGTAGLPAPVDSRS